MDAEFVRIFLVTFILLNLIFVIFKIRIADKHIKYGITVLCTIILITTGTVDQQVSAYDKSYSILEFYEAMQDVEGFPLTISDKAKDFLDQHEDLFPYLPVSEYDLPEEYLDPEIDAKHINKSPSKYGDMLMMTPLSDVLEIMEGEVINGEYATVMLISDWTGQNYLVFYNGELENIFNGSSVTVTGLPLDATYISDEVTGEYYDVIVLAGSVVWDVGE